MVSTRYNRPEEKAEREAGNLEVDLEDIDDREMRSRRRSAPGKLYKSDARFVEKQKLLNKLLEGRQTREVQQKIQELINTSPPNINTRKVRASNRADDDGNDEEDEAIEEDEVETPWSRGRKAGTTGIKRRATRASGLPSEGDELADFQDALQPELEEPRLRKRLRSSRVESQLNINEDLDLPKTRASRRSSAPSRSVGIRKIEPEEENDEEMDEEGEEEEIEEEEELINGSSRYPSRRRSRVDHFDPEIIYQTHERPRRKREVVEESSEDEEGEEEEEEEDEEQENGDAPGHRYPLRDRALVTLNHTPPKEAHNRRARGGGIGRGRRFGFGGPKRNNRRVTSYNINEDVLDPDAGWDAIKAAERENKDDHTRRRPPWEAALGEKAILDGKNDHSHKNTEITQVQVDESVDFNQVGGLDHYIKALKEMVFLPLVYPELFERFHINPPRGVLFYGPPGTGKTLVARALASHASRAGKKVSFFMRKGADVLSKWVGEAERQLRLLFEEAQKNQPAIIFFDEIDGLAPVRSSKQDQIHNSIVSTLLALMDGLDSRGQIVLIGATNRIDALDAALRRPGRFDRELVFPLPSHNARASILEIHTRKWSQPPSEDLRLHLADLCVGYCGADLKALCTEACLKALRRTYPQIYESEQKLLLDPTSVSVKKEDFLAAYEGIVPASHRSAADYSRPLTDIIKPVLSQPLSELLKRVCTNFSPAMAILQNSNKDNQPNNFSELEGLSISGMEFGANLMVRPRLLICGPENAGQNHLCPALLHTLENLPIHAIGLPSLLSDASARSPEEALVHAVIEARRSSPSILYLPHLNLWWETAPSSLRATLWMLLADLPPDLPLLFLSTSDSPISEIPEEALALFGNDSKTFVYELQAPTKEERENMFRPICTELAGAPQKKPSLMNLGPPPQLPVALESLEAAEHLAQEKEAQKLRKAWEDDEAALRTQRMGLRDIATQLLCNRQWKEFWEPVDPKEDPDYYERVKNPMDLGTILCRVDDRQYQTITQFMGDLGLISKAAKEYWEDDPHGLPEISRAKAMEDHTWEAILRRIPDDIRQKCEAIHAKGGPAPVPPGLDLPLGLPAPIRTSPNNTSDWKEERRGTRRRHRGELDDSLIFQDPEAIMRARNKAQRKAREPIVEARETAVQEQQNPKESPESRKQDAAVEKSTINMEEENDAVGNTLNQEANNEQSPGENNFEQNGLHHQEGDTNDLQEGDEPNVLQEIEIEDNIIISETEPPVQTRKTNFKTALQNFGSTLGSELFTPGLQKQKSFSRRSLRKTPNLLYGESNAEFPRRQTSIDPEQNGTLNPQTEPTKDRELEGSLPESAQLPLREVALSSQITSRTPDATFSRQIRADKTPNEVIASPIDSNLKAKILEDSRPESSHQIRIDTDASLSQGDEDFRKSIDSLLGNVVEATSQMLVGELEVIYCRLARIAATNKYNPDRSIGVEEALKVLGSL